MIYTGRTQIRSHRKKKKFQLYNVNLAVLIGQIAFHLFFIKTTTIIQNLKNMKKEIKIPPEHFSMPLLLTYTKTCDIPIS